VRIEIPLRRFGILVRQNYHRLIWILIEIRMKVYLLLFHRVTVYTHLDLLSLEVMMPKKLLKVVEIALCSLHVLKLLKYVLWQYWSVH